MKNKEIIIGKVKAKRLEEKQKQLAQPNITVTIEEIPAPISEIEVSKQSKHSIPDEKKYIDALRLMLIPNSKFISLIPCEVEPRGKPIFFYVNKYPDEDSTEISIVKLKHLKRGDEQLIYKPDWDVVEEVSNIHDSNLHNIMAFDEKRVYEGGSYMRWKRKYSENPNK